jgi:hypothetical protein
MGYAVSNIGAQKLMFHLGLGKIKEPIDCEISRLCIDRAIRCLEVNPPLIGLYRPQGPISKDSDNTDKAPDEEISTNLRSSRQNPMGERSVKTMMEGILAKRVDS